MLTRFRTLGRGIILSLLVMVMVACSTSSPTAGSFQTPESIDTVAFIQSSGTGQRGSLIPIGADYEPETLSLFVEQALRVNQDDVVELRVLLPSFSSNALYQNPADRQTNLDDAQGRADQIQAICRELVEADIGCNTTVPDIQVRSDARDPDRVAQFGSEVDGIYGLGGDQVIAMQVIANTPLEATLTDLHRRGVPLAGNSAGAGIQSRYMIAGFTGDNFAWNGLEEGAVDLAFGRDQSANRGLIFGLDLAVLEQHALQRGRLLRSLQAAAQSPGPKIGIGPDWRTGVVVEGRQRIAQTVGFSSAFVLDEETYGSFASASYQGDRRSLSIHQVGLHLLPEGDYGYDLQTRLPLLQGTSISPPPWQTRAIDFLARPSGSGPLLIAGDLLDDAPGVIDPIRSWDALRGNTVLSRFIDLARVAGGTVLVLAVGDDDLTLSETDQIGHLLSRRRLEVEQATLTVDSPLDELFERMVAVDALYITASDQSTVADLVEVLTELKIGDLNREGRVVLFDDAAAAAVGEWMTREDRPEQDDLDTKEDQASPPFLASYPFIAPGLGLIPGIAFEPRAFYDYRIGRLVAQVYRHPDTIACAIERETAVEITPEGAVVRGPAAVLMIDGREAPVLEVGSNDGIAAFWLLLDTFTTDQLLALELPT